MRVVLFALMAVQAAAFLSSSDTGSGSFLLGDSSRTAVMRSWLRSIVTLMKDKRKADLKPLAFKLETAGRTVTKGDKFGTVGNSGLAVASLLLQDPTAPWGAENQFPEWAVRVLSNTQKHLKNHKHSFILRQQITLPLPGHMVNHEPRKAFRVNANWEKFKFVLDYLNSGKYSHILLMDADATFFNPKHDTLATMSSEMDKRNASLLLADEDWWGKTGPGNTNGGVQMWKNTTYAKELLTYLIAAHMDPTASKWSCWGNEQLCLRGFLTDPNGTKKFPIDEGKHNHRLDNVMLASGLKYNRHICALPKVYGGGDGPCKTGYVPDMSEDPEIMHFMGGGKPEEHNPIFNEMLRGAR